MNIPQIIKELRILSSEAAIGEATRIELSHLLTKLANEIESDEAEGMDEIIIDKIV